MAFFDKLGEMAKNVGDKTGDMIEVGKLNSRVSEAEKRIVEKKREIGEYCWARYIANIQLDPEVAKLCAAIKEDEALIAKTQAEIRSIKADKAAAPVVVEAGLLRCQQCGTGNPEGTKFCQECGAKLETPAPAAPVEVATCPSCGFQNPAGTRFCQECGRDMEAPQEAAGPLCPSCGAVNAADDRFCKECGAPLEEAPADEIRQEPPAGPVCPGCGAVNAADDRFCKECGSVLTVAEEPAPMEAPAETAVSEEAVEEEATPAEVVPEEASDIDPIAETPAVEETIAEEPAPASDPDPIAQTPVPEEGAVTTEEEPAPVPEIHLEPEEVPAPSIPAMNICPDCGTENPPGTRFCGECGKRLEG